MNAEPSADDGDYKLVPFVLQLNGTYQQLGAYLLQSRDRPAARVDQVRLVSGEREAARQVSTSSWRSRVLAKK